MHLECQNCGTEWEYTGEKEPPKSVTCPACLYNVHLED